MMERDGIVALKAVLQAKEFEGVSFKILDRPIQNGDTYLAARNTGPHLLTAKEVDQRNRWVVPVESAYVFDIWECVPIELGI